jgi:hypothetical protein
MNVLGAQTKNEQINILHQERPCRTSGGQSPASRRSGPGSIPLQVVGFVVDKVALGAGFPCQFSFHQLLHTHLPSGAGTVGQIVANAPSGLSLTPPQEIKKKRDGNAGRMYKLKCLVVSVVTHLLKVTVYST